MMIMIRQATAAARGRELPGGRLRAEAQRQAPRACGKHGRGAAPAGAAVGRAQADAARSRMPHARRTAARHAGHALPPPRAGPLLCAAGSSACNWGKQDQLDGNLFKSHFFPRTLVSRAEKVALPLEPVLGHGRVMGKNRQFLSKHVRNEVGAFVEPEGEQFFVSLAAGCLSARAARERGPAGRRGGARARDASEDSNLRTPL